MNEQIKQQWVAELRSGKYKQGIARLHKVTDEGDKFCCLGVLCEIAVRDGVIPPPVLTQLRTGLGKIERFYRYGTEEDYAGGGYLPPEVCKWAGLSSPNPRVTIDGHPEYLSTLNDFEATLEEIADLIEDGEFVSV